MRAFHVLAVVAIASVFAPPARADEDPIAVTVTVRGSGEIWLMVGDGMSRPCESNDHMLFKNRVKAGDVIKLESARGSVCVDHTYGAFRESQWAGASIWSGSLITPLHALSGSVSTDNP